MNEGLEGLSAAAEVYGLLSTGYSSPDRKSFNSGFPELLKRAFNNLSFFQFENEMELISRFFNNVKEPLELMIEYTRLFRGPVKALVYPYESMHVESEIMGQSTLKVLKYYSESGIALNEGFSDLPDHIAAELEFVSYLCLKERETLQEANVDKALLYRKARHSFTREHLLNWVPHFTREIEKNTTSPFYLALAKITTPFIVCDFDRAGRSQPVPA